MGVVKRFEWLLKNLLAVVAAVAWWRPNRSHRAHQRLREPGPKRVLLVRIDNRVGEALLTTPLMTALANAGHEVHLLAHPKMRRVLDGHPQLFKIWDYRPTWTALMPVRRQAFDVVINCGNWSMPAVTSALVARFVGSPSAVLGPAHLPTGWLMDVPVIPRAEVHSEAAQRSHLADPLLHLAAVPPLSFRPTAPSAIAPSPYAVVNPGGRLGYRRVSPEHFAEAARVLVENGVLPVVTWGPGEEALANEVCRLCPQAMKAPPTSVDELASAMRGARLTVCNNTGPMHLAVAVGCPTLALFFHMDVARWGHPHAPHLMLDLTGRADGLAKVREETERLCRATTSC